MFEEAATLLRLEQDDRVDDVPPLSNNMGDLLALDVDAMDAWNLRDNPSSGPIDVRSSVRGDFPAIREKCRCTA